MTNGDNQNLIYKKFLPNKEALDEIGLRPEQFFNFLSLDKENGYVQVPEDAHVHSKYSFDGKWPIPDIVAKAIEKNMIAFAITDHNCLGIQSYLHKHEIPDNQILALLKTKDKDGNYSQESVFLIPGCEITCNLNMRLSNTPKDDKKNQMSLHINCFGFNRNNDKIKALIKKQEEITKEINYGLFLYIINNLINGGVFDENFDINLALKKYKTMLADKSKKDEKIIYTLNKSSIEEYLKETYPCVKEYCDKFEQVNKDRKEHQKEYFKKIKELHQAKDKKTRRILKYMKKAQYTLTEEEELYKTSLFDISNYNFNAKYDCSIEEVIDAVHHAGGYCLIAHPLKSIRKYYKNYFPNVDLFHFSVALSEKLIEAGIDGVEICNVYNEGSVEQKYNNFFYKRVKNTKKQNNRPIIIAHNTDTHEDLNNIGVIKTKNKIVTNYLKSIFELNYAKLHNKKTEIQKSTKNINSKQVLDKVIKEFSAHYDYTNVHNKDIENYIKSICPKKIRLEELTLDDFMFSHFNLNEVVYILKKLIQNKIEYENYVPINENESKHNPNKKRAYKCRYSDIEAFIEENGLCNDDEHNL